MKFIGQYIQDFIARFRSDVYLEDVSTGTIASGGNLGLDSNNKIVKADVSADGDITSVVAGTGLSGGGTSGDVTLNIEAAQSTVTSLGTLTALQVDQLNMNGHAITSSAEIDLAPHAGASVLNITSDDVLIVSSTDQKPAVEIRSTLNTPKPPSLTFTKDKGAAGADDDFIGIIAFNSDNDAQQIETFAQISSSIETAADGGEEGKIEIGVSAKTSGSGGSGSANVITGVGNGSNVTDVTIGLGATGTTTIAGTLTMGSTAFVDNSGVVQVATQGTINHDSLAHFVAAEHYRWDNDISGTATINAANIPTLNQNTTGSAATLTTPRAINGVNFNGSAPITITAAGSTLSDTVTVAKGGTGATSLTSNAVLLGNGTGAVEASSHLSYSQLSAGIDALVIGDGSTAGVVITTDNAAPLNLTVEANSGTNAAGGDLTLAAGTSTGNAAGGDIIFRSSPTAGGSGTSVNVPAEIAVLDNTGNLQIDGNLTPAGFVLDGNTITGIDDSSEFTDNDAHIMTSAAINDRFAQINADTTGNAATATNLTASTSTAVGLGTIELGHATDTTIARSAAGKVTIEGAPIQTTQIVTSHHNMSLDGGSATADFYFPINTLADGSSSSLYYTRLLPAYNGKIIKILFRASNNMGSSCTIFMSRRAHDGASTSHQTSSFQAQETFNGATLSTVIVPCGVGGSNAADWVFEEGDQLGFSLIKNTTATNVDLTVTIVYEYTIS